MKNTIIFTLFFCVSLMVGLNKISNAADEPFFLDDFETGGLYTNNGTRWGGTNGDVTVSDKHREPHSGSKSLKFTFNATDNGYDSNADKWFHFGNEVEEIYVRFYIYFPDGTEPWGEKRYEHRNQYTQKDPDHKNHVSQTNNKVIRIWHKKGENKDGIKYYEMFKYGASFWATNDQNGDSNLALHGRRVNKWSPDKKCTGMAGLAGSWRRSEFELGKWLSFEFHFKGDDGSGNGVAEFWLNGGELTNGEPTISNTQVRESPCPRYLPPNYFQTGYLLGWANSGFDNETNVYIDDVAFSTSYIGPISGINAPEDNMPPAIKITSPENGNRNTYELIIEGEASDNTGVTSVTVNGTPAVSSDGYASWNVKLFLSPGKNTISAIARDTAGKTSESAPILINYIPVETYIKSEEVNDTFINRNNSTNSILDRLYTYTWPADKIANAIIMKWDLSTIIPDNAIIHRADIHLYLNEVGGDTSYDLSVHKIINADPDVSRCDGYTYNGENPWNDYTWEGYNNSGDDSHIPLAQANIDLPEDNQTINTDLEFKTWSVTNMVQDWVNNPSENFGLLINSDPIATSDSVRSFSSSEAENESLRPKLIILYSNTEPSAPKGLKLLRK